MQPQNFFARSDIVVIGNNFEMADYDNPRGEIYGFATYVIAEDHLGYRRSLHVQTLPLHVGEIAAMADAERMAQALNARIKSGKLPVGWSNWTDDHPAYGSEAWVESGEEDNLIEWEMSLENNY